MCVACAMAAATGVTGARSWLQTHHMGWVTPARLRRITIALMVAGFSVSTFGLSGSAKHAGPDRVALTAHVRHP